MSLLASLRNNRFVLKIFLIGLFLRIALGVISYYLDISTGRTGEGEQDSLEYYRVGRYLAQSWKEGKIPQLPHGKPGYYVYNGIIFFIMGYNPLYVQVINSFINALVIVYIYLVAQSIYNQKIAKIASSIFAFYPEAILLSISNVKDSLVTFLVIIAIYHGIKVAQRKEMLFGYVWIALAIVGIYTMRPYVAYYTWISVTVFQFIFMKKNYIKQLLIASPLIILIIIAASRGYRSHSFYADAFVKMVTAERVHVGGPGSYFTGRTFSGLSDTIRFLPLGTIHFMLTPLPWKASSMFGVFGAIMWHALIPYLIYGAFYSIRFKWRESFILYVPIIMITVTIILIFAGGSARHRIQVTPFLIIFIALGMSRMSKRLFPAVLGFYLLYISWFWFYQYLGIQPT